MIEEKVFVLEEELGFQPNATVSIAKNSFPLIDKLFQEQILPWICEKFEAESFEVYHQTSTNWNFPEYCRYTVKMDENENYGMAITFLSITETAKTISATTASYTGNAFRTIQLGVDYLSNSESNNNLIVASSISSNSSGPTGEWVHVERVDDDGTDTILTFRFKIEIACRFISNDEGVKVLHISGKNSNRFEAATTLYCAMVEDCFERKYLWIPTAVNNVRRLDSSSTTADTFIDNTGNMVITTPNSAILTNGVYSTTANAIIPGLKCGNFTSGITVPMWGNVMFNGERHLKMRDVKFYMKY